MSGQAIPAGHIDADPIIIIREAIEPISIVIEGDTKSLSISPVSLLAEIPGPPGPPGPGGPPGDTTINRIAMAGDDIGGHRIVKVQDGIAQLAELGSPLSAIAMTLHAAAAGTEIALCFQGLIEESSWTFVEGPLWLGENALPTQIPPASGPIILLGCAIAPTAIIFSPEIIAQGDDHG